MERQRKRELRELNFRAWAGHQDVFPVQSSLDSSMKKNTAFIKRLRTAITASSQSQFVHDIRTLSLHKYLSEIISACYEGLCKLKSPGEIAAGVEIVSALHQRFGPGEFTSYIAWYIGRGLSTPDKSHLKTLAQDVREREEKERLARQRVLLRVTTELWLVAVLRSLDDVSRPEEAAVKGKDAAKLGESSGRAKVTANGNRADNADAEPFPLEVLKDMLGHDREHINLPLVVIFVKAFAWDILGAKTSSAEGRKTVTEDGATTADKNEDNSASDEDDTGAEDPPITSPELRQRFKNILTRYFEDVKAHLLRDQKQLVNQGRKNAEAYVKSGEVFEDRQANYEKQVKAQERLATNAQILADAIGAEMPDLKEKDSSANAGDGVIGLVKTKDYLRGQGDGPGIWEDEEERRFYENMIDLKDRVPGILLEEPKKKKADNDEQVGKKVETKLEAESKEKWEPSAETQATEADDQSTAIANKSVGAQVDAILARLPELNTKDMVDQAAIDFCFLNSKASRNRLIKAVQDIPKGRSDLLPLYSRLIATLGKYMPDVSQGLVSYLDDEFRSLQRRKSKDFLGQVRTQNVRYLAELTKFGVVPEHVIFHCLKVSLDDFSRMNIEITCNLLENCGRYLLRNPDTSPRMASFLETLQRKKAAQVLGQQERMLIENAIYYVNPPERAAIEQKERTPIELFLRKLIYTDLTKRTLDQIVKQIRKLHWEEDDIVKLLHKVFAKPGKIKYSNIHLLAVILGSLHRYHQDFTISVIDDVIESITFGLELNDFKFNQRRIAEVKYLGELYIYRMVDSPLIFDTLYKLLNYGYEGGYARPGLVNPLDLPDDYFRIRLVCNLLETCGMYYDKGAAKKKLDFFLTYFQYYICTKDPLPMDVEFIVQDAYMLTRPQWKLITNLEEASRSFAEAVKQNYQTSTIDKPVEADEDESASDDNDDGPDDEDVAVPDGEDDKSSGEEGEWLTKKQASEDDEPIERVLDDDEEEQIVVTRQEDERDPEAEADFDRELAKMMSESLDSRKFERKPVFDVPLPMRRGRDAAATAEDSGGEAPAPSHAPPVQTMKFSLLSKRGNKQQTRAIDLPSDSNFALAMRSKQQAEREEQQRIKNLVLNYDLRDDNDTDGDSPFHFSLQPNFNRKRTETGQGLDKTHNPYAQPRLDKAGNNRSNQRARKLQLSDVNWYDKTSPSQSRSQSQSTSTITSPETDPTVSDRRNSFFSTRSRGPQRKLHDRSKENAPRGRGFQRSYTPVG
ncbi:ARM repeat-containing protein [Lindgomyces ingoldianus]|uniref:ARM repeat-containing protein n=1 Tax=Lindgomyces ingoldianus TaxID=673940 RepID=A0ACB6RBN8_9PLEO|nr:ARM repeat-containing protein [Lindgomyces ingoldianus]KAF2476168.1 ARM repeat-containing protein [Lindgomyces ingoldianus]